KTPVARHTATVIKTGRPYAEAVVIFLISRVLVLLSLFFSFKFVPQNPSGAFWNANPHWYRFFLRYDSGWYLTIARHGYSYTGGNLTQQSVTFYPLYPLLSRLLHNVFGIDYNAA